MAAEMAMAKAQGTAADGRTGPQGQVVPPPQTAPRAQGRGSARQASGGTGPGRQMQSVRPRISQQGEAGTAFASGMGMGIGMGAHLRLHPDPDSGTDMRTETGSSTDTGTGMRAQTISGTGGHKGRGAGPGTGRHRNAGAPRKDTRPGPRRTAQQGTAA